MAYLVQTGEGDGVRENLVKVILPLHFGVKPEAGVVRWWLYELLHPQQFLFLKIW